jgi:branched-subunit amino acid aminotransferase/4-amino-4-deoxychorismate lyase
MSAGSGSISNLAQGDDSVLTMIASRVDDSPLDVSAMMSPWRRNEHSPLAGLKCASYAENLFALQHARESGFDEILFLNTAGDLCEAATSNVFLVHHDCVITPPLSSGCLPGVTRAVAMELAVSMGIRCKEQTITLDQLIAANELFLTSSTKGVVAITRLQDRVIHEGSLTASLRSAWCRTSM